MSDLQGVPSLKGRVGDAEWQARVELAALYRLVVMHGWEDLIFTHISARVPGTDHFLINPYGLLFDEITASSLIKIDVEGNVLQETPHPTHYAAFVIHSAIHMGRPDGHWVIHQHSNETVAVSAQSHGLLPISQYATLVTPLLAYHDYEGLVIDLDERGRIVRDMGDKPLMILRNHGVLSVAKSAGEAWIQLYFLETACQQQVMALTTGYERVVLAPEPSQNANQRLVEAGRMEHLGALTWPGLLRRLQREQPGFDS